MGFSNVLFPTVELPGYQSEILGMISTIFFAVLVNVRIKVQSGLTDLAGIVFY